MNKKPLLQAPQDQWVTAVDRTEPGIYYIILASDEHQMAMKWVLSDHQRLK